MIEGGLGGGGGGGGGGGSKQYKCSYMLSLCIVCMYNSLLLLPNPPLHTSRHDFALVNNALAVWIAAGPIQNASELLKAMRLGSRPGAVPQDARYHGQQPGHQGFALMPYVQHQAVPIAWGTNACCTWAVLPVLARHACST